MSSVLVLDQQIKLLQLLGRKYDWKFHIRTVSSASPEIPTTVTKRRGTQSTRKKCQKPPTIIFSDDSNDDELEKSFAGISVSKNNIMSPPHHLLERPPEEISDSPMCTEILSAAQKSRRTRRSLADMKSFSRNRAEMANEMYEKYNTSIFKSKLPHDMSIVWNKNLSTTAGRAFKDSSGIELSVKVIDTPLRLRDTLLHEMCHIAVFTLPTTIANRNAKPHGVEFWYWANTVNRTIPDAVNDRCHSYVIFKPFQFRCTNEACGQLFERHSKNGLDIDRKCCGKCKSRIEFVGAVKPDGTVSFQKLCQPVFN